MIWHALSILHCIVAPFPCTLQTFHYTYHWLTPVHCDNQYIFFLALSAKSFCDCKYLSTIAYASEDMFGESTAAKFLLDNSPLFDMYSVPSRLLFATCYDVHLHSVCSIFQRMFCLPHSHLSPYHLFYELYQVSVAACPFLLNFRHGLSIDPSHMHLSIYKRSFYQEFQQISKWCSFENSLRKVGHIGLSHGCHVIWCRSLIGCVP